MRIALIVEGSTEKALLPLLRDYLKSRVQVMPRIQAIPCDGRIPTGAALRKLVLSLLEKRPSPFDAVIALTDVYTGDRAFTDAADAKQKMREWVGDGCAFYPHAAQHDFEAWLFPYWPVIQSLAGSNARRPGGPDPELVNHGRPPAEWLRTVFRSGGRQSYVKTRDAQRILRDQDLAVAVAECTELRELVRTILTLAGADPVSP